MPCRDIQYTGEADWAEIKGWLAGRENPDQKVEVIVRDILDNVKDRGDAALVEYTAKFDSPDFAASMLRVPVEAIDAARTDIPADDLAILEEAAANIREFHQNQKQKSWLVTQEDGTVLGQLVRPVDRVGLYVPGGQGGETPLISSMLMNAIPAQVAGVERIVAVSPPRKDGTLNPYILAAASVLGLDEIYCAGSAWAIAALAYGTQTLPAVDVIAGPGNIFVTTAKRLLIGTIGIDMIAGPSEVTILADESANPKHLAADMLSQAEHDPQASAICVTTSAALATALRAELETQCAALPRNEIAKQSLADWGGIALVADLQTGIDLVNRLAPEHFELAVADPWSVLGRIRNAGAIFMGENAPEPVGDYFAGPNHVLPTMGTARFSSALSVENFCKKTSLVATSPAFLDAHADKIARLARLEGLEAHARSVESRKK